MNGFFWGGVARGLQQGAERQRQREMLDLQKKRFDLEDKESKFKMQELERQLKARLTGADILERGTPDQFPQAAEQAQPTGDEFQDAFQSGGLRQSMLPQPASQERQIAAAFIRAGMNPPASLFSQQAQTQNRPLNVGPGSTVFDPTSKEVLFENKNVQERMPFDAANRRYIELRQQGADHATALAEAAQAREQLSFGSGFGGRSGTDVAKNLPQARSGAQNVAAGTAAGGEQTRAQRNVVGLQSSKFTANVARGLLEQIPPPDPNLLSRGTEFVRQKYQELSQSNPALARYESTKNAYATQLARSVLAEKGVLTDRDREVIVQNFPNALDTQSVRVGKMDTLDQFIELTEKFESMLAQGQEISSQAFRAEFDAIAAKQAATVGTGQGGVSSPQPTPSLGPGRKLRYNLTTKRIE